VSRFQNINKKEEVKKMKKFELKVESLTIQVLVVGLASIGFLLAVWSLGLLGQTVLQPYLIVLLMFIYGGACLSESIWENGIKALKDLTPLNIAGIILGSLAIIVGIIMLPFTGISLTSSILGERVMGALSILFLSLSVFLILELFE
jgi:FtsH-binding integral membrane protein